MKIAAWVLRMMGFFLVSWDVWLTPARGDKINEYLTTHFGNASGQIVVVSWLFWSETVAWGGLILAFAVLGHPTAYLREHPFLAIAFALFTVCLIPFAMALFLEMYFKNGLIAWIARNLLRFVAKPGYKKGPIVVIGFLMLLLSMVLDNPF